MGAAFVLVAAACTSGSNSSKSSTTKTKKIGSCVIKARTSCPGADLRFADLEGVNLTGADLTGADLTGADLSDANLTDSVLSGATIVNANAKGVSFRAATMKATNLTGTDLTDADFRGATIVDDNLLGTIRCRTIRTDGTIDNTSCPGPVVSTTTTKPGTTTTRHAVTTTTRPAPTPTTAAPAPAACTSAAVYSGYVATWGTPRGSVVQALPLCSGGYASQIITVTYGGTASDQFSVFQSSGSNWIGKGTDIAADAVALCTSLSIPPAVSAALGCA